MTPKNTKIRGTNNRNIKVSKNPTGVVSSRDSPGTRNIDNIHPNNELGKYMRESQRFQRIIRSTVNHVHRTKTLDIINGSDFNHCITTLEGISQKLTLLDSILSKSMKVANTYADEDYEHSNTGSNSNQTIAKKCFETLYDINNELTLLFRTYGTFSMTDFLSVCVGTQYVINIDEDERHSGSQRWRQIIECVHPTSYRFVPWKSERVKPQREETLTRHQKHNISKNVQDTQSKQSDSRDTVLRRNRIIEDSSIVEYAQTLDCFDLARSSKDFQQRVYGIKIAFQDYEHKKTLIVNCIVDDVPLWSFDDGSKSINCLKTIETNIKKLHNPADIDLEPLNGFVECLTMKDVLVYSIDELSHRFVGHISQAQRLHRLPLANLVAEFIEADQYAQRSMLLQLLTMSHKPEYQYTAYLLFDLLSTDTGNVVDTYDQKILFDSLPCKAKQFFKDALKRTVQYTNSLGNFDINKIPLEQQICLMKVDDSVKEKAMLKLKEVKNKSEDSGTKARQYLEALLKIPFGIYREEPILSLKNRTKTLFNELMTRVTESSLAECSSHIPKKDNYTGIEIATYTNEMKKTFIEHKVARAKSLIVTHINSKDTREDLFEFIRQLNLFIREWDGFLASGPASSTVTNGHNSNGASSPHIRKIPKSGRNIQQMLTSIYDFIEGIGPQIVDLTEYLGLTRDPLSGTSIFSVIESSIKDIDDKTNEVRQYISNVGDTLTKAVHGHDKAKRQIERIIGQWINGEQTGYCFGFEGPPGVGKTSLAKKGIANCLIDSDGTPRPFTFIAIGGASNGSTLEGHNYTYVASTWGRIVDVLMEKKCMNPIIFIDELDKVSKTEHGREIIGILTHLIDPTQNDTFQDKYFHGIDIDLSKALFIFSYNDVDAIDRILLDRIHRIKFNSLTLDDKLTVVKDYLLPEVLEKMGLSGVVDISDDVITFIIEKYTNEPGVRKLRELLFEIVGEVNISVLRGEYAYQLPVVITIDDVKTKYLHDRDMVRPYVISRTKATIGVINGLYATTMGRGGVLPIEVSFLPCSQLLELHLTGMQGDVMKESMQVARTLAFELASESLNDCLKELDGKAYKRGLHIHVPEGATKKDGPSAGTAITIAIYSRITGLPIRHDVAITGEICLGGKVTAIGGLEDKILGGIKAGVKHFLFPKENEKDYDKIRKTYDGKGLLDGVEFTSIDDIQQALALTIEM